MPKLRPARQAEFERMRRRLLYAVLALVALMIVGTLGFSLFAREDQNLIDSFYMTVITLTTVGYEEAISLTAHPWGKLFASVLLLGGMGIVAYSVALFATFLIEGHVFNVFARRRMQKRIETMSGHYIVCGSTPDAVYVAAELLSTQRQLVLISPTAQGLEEANALFEDLVGIVGDPSDDEILLQAGVDRAAGLVAAVGSDKDNVIVSLTARRLAPRIRIVGSSEAPQNEAKLRTAGADAVVSPCRIGGLRMASELVRPTVVSFLDKMLRDKEMSLRVEEVVVPAGAPADRTLASLDLPGVAGALVLAVVPPGETRFEFNPPSDRALGPGTTLVVMVSAGGRERLEQHLAP